MKRKAENLMSVYLPDPAILCMHATFIIACEILLPFMQLSAPAWTTSLHQHYRLRPDARLVIAFGFMGTRA